ncbi:Zinc finger protein 792 [Tupaia chinensis]|uniref:Zinc finger protein 792 n=1 Tax=Tupaia chinensis TaxID=246437 RepID=L8XZ57_TUPCH|nr:Zinc finger protein 792 [Tupaia chinensis]
MLENFALIASLGLMSFRSHVVAQLEMGEEPWVPDRVDISSAMARGAYSRPASGHMIAREQEPSSVKSPDSQKLLDTLLQNLYDFA